MIQKNVCPSQPVAQRRGLPLFCVSGRHHRTGSASVGNYPLLSGLRHSATSVLCLFLLAIAAPGMAQDEKLDVPALPSSEPIRVLLVDGQNNHAIWPKTTDLMKSILEDTGRFSVEIARTKPKGIDEEFRPDFSKYQVVVSNYNGEEWPEATKSAFETFVAGGGGLVVVHAADNAFPAWPAWNRMIGLGGWGGRNESSGPWLYLDHAGQPVRDAAPGNGGSHGDQHEFVVVTRLPEHPVMAGLPAEWLHAQDELYDSLRGPAEEIEILATAWADPEKGGTGRHEPVVMAIGYEAGRVFHTTLGHGDYSVECAGFAALLQRGTEWAATGEVTQPPPDPASLPTTTATAVWKSSAAAAQSAGDGR